AIVIRRPAPRIGADPGPAIIVFPDPAAILIGRPIRADVGGLPNRAVVRIVHPPAVLIQILGAADGGAHVLVALRTQDKLIAVVIPAVESVVRNGAYNLELGVRSRAARLHCSTRLQAFSAPLAIHFSLA